MKRSDNKKEMFVIVLMEVLVYSKSIVGIHKIQLFLKTFIIQK